jgi:MbtH protein
MRDFSSFVVVVNEEDQYSIWPDGLALPMGWREAGMRGARAECLAFIRDVWTDIRPLSVRRATEDAYSSDHAASSKISRAS